MKLPPETHITYSIILPVFNEEECLANVLEGVLSAMSGFSEFFEVICIDDGSSDRTWDIISSWKNRSPFIKGIRFSRNFGHQAAIRAGINECTGEFIAVMDADGQDPPETLLAMLRKCAEGYDVVYGVRKNRKEGLFKRLAYQGFYLFYKSIVPFHAPLDAGDFSVFNRKVAEFLKSLPEKNPFIRGLRSWYGGKQTEFAYDRKKRESGKSKYSLGKLVLLAVNGSISFSKIPLRLISLLGIIVSTLSFGACIFLVIRKLTIGIPLLGWTSTIVAITFFGGLNLLVLGIVGEYIGNIYDEVKDRPNFLVEEKIGFESVNNVDLPGNKDFISR